MKRHAREWEKIFVVTYPKKDSYKEHRKNSQNQQQEKRKERKEKTPISPIKKWAKDTMRHFTKDDERQMANFTLNIKRCSTPLAIQEMQIKTMRYPYTPIRMANIKKKKTDYTGKEKLNHTSLVGK